MARCFGWCPRCEVALPAKRPGRAPLLLACDRQHCVEQGHQQVDDTMYCHVFPPIGAAVLVPPYRPGFIPLA